MKGFTNYQNELNERQFYSNTNMSLLEDIINEKKEY